MRKASSIKEDMNRGDVRHSNQHIFILARAVEEATGRFGVGKTLLSTYFQ